VRAGLDTGKLDRELAELPAKAKAAAAAAHVDIPVVPDIDAPLKRATHSGKGLADVFSGPLAGAVSALNDLTVDDTLNIDDTDNALAGTQTITPTATFYEFAPATTLTLTIATGSATVGDFLILQNTVSTSTVIVDTGATVGGGNITLGANDLALFIFTNTKWVEIASPDNS